MDATADKVEPVSKEGGDENARVIKAALRLYDAGYEREKQNIAEGEDDGEVRAGIQWPAAVRAEREADGRPCETVNQMGQFVRQVTGDMRQMRPAIKCVAADDEATDEGADAMADVIRYVENRSDAPGIYFQGADSQVTSGMGHWRVITEYAGESTFNQEIRIAPIADGLRVIWDEDAELPTREDAMECIVPVDLSRSKFEKLYPDAMASDFSTTDVPSVQDWCGSDRVRVGEYWFKEKTKKTLALLQDGSVRDLTNAKREEMAEIAPLVAVDAQGRPRIEERDAYKVRRALVTAKEVIEGPQDWPGSLIPIVPVVGEEIRLSKRVVRHGVVRFAKAPQRIYNYAVSADIEVTALQPKAPFVGTEKNFEKYEDEWEDANRKNLPYLTYTPDGGNGGIAPQRVQPAVSSQGIGVTVERAQRDMYAVTGIYPAALGAKSNETSGKAVLARQQEGDTGTFVYIDNWARAIRHTGKILVDLIPKIYDTARVLRIVGEDGKVEKVEINQPRPGEIAPNGKMRIFNDVTAGSYDVAMSMGPSYATKRAEARDGMMQFATAVPQAAQVAGDLIAKAQDWPMADEFAERMEMLLPPEIRAAKAEKDGQPIEPPPPDPAQQAAMQMQVAAAQAELAGKQADARKKVAEADKAEFELQAIQAAPVISALSPPTPVPEPQPQPVPVEDDRFAAMAEAIQDLQNVVSEIMPIVAGMAPAMPEASEAIINP